jgi:hypothetical protein
VGIARTLQVKEIHKYINTGELPWGGGKGQRVATDLEGSWRKVEAIPDF